MLDDDFTFEEDLHRYINARGTVCPSVTQRLKLEGIFDYSHVKPDVLDNARRRGANVHKFTAEHDLHGFLDETWLQEDESPRFQAWLKFRRESGFVVREIERPMLRTISGVEIGGTPDRVGFIGAQKFVLDIKCCAQNHPGWALQLAMYELMLTGAPRVGHMGRMVVILGLSSKYKIITFDDPTDGAAVQHIMQKIAAENSIKAWMYNKGLLKTA